MKMKRAMLIGVLAVAVAALAVPMLGLRARAAAVKPSPATPRALPGPAVATPSANQKNGQHAVMSGGASEAIQGRLSGDIREDLFGPASKASKKAKLQHRAGAQA